jgi:hypothetical protein
MLNKSDLIMLFFPSSGDGNYVLIGVISWMKLSVLILKDQAGLQQAVDQHQPEAGHHHLHGAHEDHAPGTAQYN